MPSQFEYDHLLHPTTLDSCLQSTFVPTADNSEGRIPTAIESVYVSADVPRGAGAQLIGYSTLIRTGLGKYVGSVVMTDKAWNEPKVVVKGLSCTSLKALDHKVTIEKQPWDTRKLCSNLIWREDLDELGQVEALEIFTPDTPIDSKTLRLCERAAAILMKNTLAQISSNATATMTPHLSQYIHWMRQRVVAIGDVALLPDSDEEDEDLLQSVQAISIEGRLMCAVTKGLPQILEGSTSAQALMNKNNMLINYYSDAIGIRACNDMIAKWLSLSGHKRPSQKILEIGAGTGSLTLRALQVLGGQHGTTPTCSKYTFTDWDTDCFATAQMRLEAWKEFVRYKQLDITNEPIDQGFELENYDIILAGHVSFSYHDRDYQIYTDPSQSERSFMRQRTLTLL